MSARPVTRARFQTAPTGEVRERFPVGTRCPRAPSRLQGLQPRLPVRLGNALRPSYLVKFWFLFKHRQRHDFGLDSRRFHLDKCLLNRGGSRLADTFNRL